MTQTRIVLRPKDAPTIEQIMSVTGVDSASDAVSMLISRYGQALVTWWNVDPHQCKLEPQAIAPPSQPVALDSGSELAPLDF
jgi:hypothetical protein